MTEDDKVRRDATYVPPPQPVKPHASHDNAVEMAAGGEEERDALAARDERLTQRTDMPQQPAGRPVARETPDEQRAAAENAGRTDSPEGTGVGYAGEGGESYGTQGATGATDRLANAPETTGRRAEMHTGDTRRTIDIERSTRDDMQQDQEEMQHMEHTSGADKHGATQQSTGSATPSQGTGSTPKSHGGSGGNQATQHGSGSETGGAQSTGGAGAGGTRTDAVQGGAGTVGGSKAESATEAAKAALDTAKGHVDDTAKGIQKGVGDVAAAAKEQVQSGMSDATGGAQDTLKSVQANVQARSEQVRGAVSERTDQFKGALNERTGQLKNVAGERGDLAKTTADEKATQAGERLTGLASTLREKTQALGEDSPVAGVANRAVGALEQTGSYLTDSTPDDWVGDLQKLISRKPLESILAAAAIGYLAARAFRK